MQKENKIIVLILTLFFLTPVITLAKGGGGKGGYFNQFTTTVLTQEQENTLLFIREEEKLARDVYLKLYNKWQKNVFINIANSEQKHMDAMLKKIEFFGLEDPVIPRVGGFYNVDLQDMYDQLVAEGSQSYIDALRVGAFIEDMDFQDLQIAIEETDDLALKTTYESLLDGSKNHLRAFVGLLQQQGEEYSPQYIEPELYDAILGF